MFQVLRYQLSGKKARMKSQLLTTIRIVSEICVIIRTSGGYKKRLHEAVLSRVNGEFVSMFSGSRQELHRQRWNLRQPRAFG